MHLPSSVAEALGVVAYVFAEMQPYLPTYAHLIASALFPIYAGAHASLSCPSSASHQKKERKDRKKAEDENEDDEDDEIVQRMEGLSPTDAIFFPILAGCTLAGLYFLIKWLQDPALLNKILNWYFAAFSVFAVARLVSDGLTVSHSLLFPRQFSINNKLFEFNPVKQKALCAGQAPRSSPFPGVLTFVPLPASIKSAVWRLRVLPSRKLAVSALVRNVFDFKIKVGLFDLVGLAIGVGSVLYYNFIGKPWYLTNLMGFGFAYGSLQLLSPTTFWTGSLILSALFFYDIYFVFFTPMMVTVAKSLDIPIKLMFPRPPPPDAAPGDTALSMLGLGDVVLPGIMIGLALRFDLYLFYLKKQTKGSNRGLVLDSKDGSGRTADSIDDVDSRKLVRESNDKAAQKAGEIDTVDDTKSAHDSNDNKGQTPSTIDLVDNIVKSPYVSVAASLGDRFWTGTLLRSDPRVRGSFPKPFFNASIVGYIVGMCTTLVAMQVSDHPQPALLYLVPGVLFSLWGYALLSGQMKEFWAFSDAGDEEDEKKKEEEHSKPSKVQKETGADEQVRDVARDAVAHESTTKKKEANVLFSFQIQAPPPMPKATDDAVVAEEVSATGAHPGEEPVGKRRRVN